MSTSELVLAQSPTLRAPDIEYGQLAPMLIVFGVAVAGVLVEAFLPRRGRYSSHLVLALGGLTAAFVAVVMLAGTRDSTVAGAVAVDGPTLFLQGTILLISIPAILLIAERSVDSGVAAATAEVTAASAAEPEGGTDAFTPQAFAVPGSVAEREATKNAPGHTEVFPLTLFAVGGMLLFPASNDLLTMFVALEVLSLPLYLLCGLARRRRLLSQEAALKYFLLGAFSSAFFLFGVALLYGYAGTVELPRIADALARGTDDKTLALIGTALLSVGLLFKIGAVPFHSWIPDVYQGAPTPITAFMAAATKVAAVGAMLRIFYVALPDLRADWRPVMWGVAILTMVVGAVMAVTQNDVKRMLAYSSVAHAGFILHRSGRGQPGRSVVHDVLPLGLRIQHARRVCRRHAGAGQSGRGDGPVPLGGAGPALAPGRRGLRAVPSGVRRNPLDEWVRQQVRGLPGRHRGRRRSARSRRCRQQRDRGVLLRPGHRPDVLLGAAERRPDDRGAQHVHRRGHRGRSGGDGGARNPAAGGTRSGRPGRGVLPLTRGAAGSSRGASVRCDGCSPSGWRDPCECGGMQTGQDTD